MWIIGGEAQLLIVIAIDVLTLTALGVCLYGLLSAIAADEGASRVA